MPKNQDQFISASQAALSLGVDPGSIYRLACRRVLNGQLVEGPWIISLASVERLKAAREAQAAKLAGSAA